MMLLAIALSSSYITVSTSADYIRVYTLFGTPYRIYRQKSQTVTCAAWRDYIMTVGNGPAGGGGCATLTYSIENVRHDEICQNEDTVALTEGSELRSVFFSDKGVRTKRGYPKDPDGTSWLISIYRTLVYTTRLEFF